MIPVQHILDVKEYTVTSPFGPRKLYIGGKWVEHFHNGIDLKPVVPVIAPERGLVIGMRNTVSESLTERKRIIDNKITSLYAGNYVVLQHGKQTTHCLHMKMGSIPVKLGDIVEKGKPIGFVGASGYVTGAHLHFEIREGSTRINPALFLEGKYMIEAYQELIPIIETRGAYFTPTINNLRMRLKPNGPIHPKEHFPMGVPVPVIGVTVEKYGDHYWYQCVQEGQVVYCGIDPQNRWGTFENYPVDRYEIISEKLYRKV